MELTEKIFTLVCLGLATSIVSLTVTKAVAFRWLRRLMGWSAFTKELFSCPFCFSYYVAGALWYAVAHVTGNFNLLQHLAWVGELATYFCVIGVASVFSGAIFYLFSLMETE